MIWQSPKLITSFLIIFLVIVADQSTKWLVVDSRVSWICNTGFAFGIGEGWFSSLIALFVLGVVGILLLREKRQPVFWGYTLVVAGGISNLIDRLVRDCVIDFIDFKIWPSFNLADSAITLGAMFLAIQLIGQKIRKHTSS